MPAGELLLQGTPEEPLETAQDAMPACQGEGGRTLGAVHGSDERNQGRRYFAERKATDYWTYTSESLNSKLQS